MSSLTTLTLAQTQEELLIAAVGSVKNLVRYKLGSRHRHETEDILQKINCSLLVWQSRNPVELTAEEWTKIAKTCATHAVSRFFDEQSKLNKIEPDIDAALLETLETLTAPAAAPIEGNTNAEVYSLLRRMLVALNELSLRQRYAFMLGSEFLIGELIFSNVCTTDDLAAMFDITRPQMYKLLASLPLAEDQLIQLISLKLDLEINCQQLWEARSRAKAKLLSVMLA